MAMFLGLGLAAVSSTALACLSLAPAADEWVSCARKVLSSKAEHEANRLYNVRIGGFIYRTYRIDKRGEARWFSAWRTPLARTCGSLAEVRRKDAHYQSGFLPERGLDEIDMVAWGSALRK